MCEQYEAEFSGHADLQNTVAEGLREQSGWEFVLDWVLRELLSMLFPGHTHTHAQKGQHIYVCTYSNSSYTYSRQKYSIRSQWEMMVTGVRDIFLVSV